jgi:omega-6 fatty acid desaturase (delta-12 desaturase)
VGTICHSLLLVPYHPWRVTHGRHHNNTGSCENDEVFAPSTRSDWAHEMLRETPLANLWGIVLMLTVGWLPGYLVFNATGPAKYRGKNANHFSPTAVFFKPDEYWLVVQSNIAFFAAVALLAFCVYTFGAGAVFFYYGVPYLVVNNNLVLITYLQHTDVFMPHFREKEWTWLRGAMCTVDRDFGFFMNRALHHITDTHVCHHIFSKMPFYHAQEATVHIKRVLGPYYLKDNTSTVQALWRSYNCCQFIEDDGDVVFYKNIK